MMPNSVAKIARMAGRFSRRVLRIHIPIEKFTLGSMGERLRLSLLLRIKSQRGVMNQSVRIGSSFKEEYRIWYP